MKQFNQVHQAFQGIFSHDDYTAAFVDFTQGVRDLGPSPDDMEFHSYRHPRMLRVIRYVRAIESSTRGEGNGPYFRGSGIVVVAAEGEARLLAVDYQSNGLRADVDDEVGDPVAAQWGNYQQAAWEKAGRAVLAFRLAPTTAAADIYKAVNDTMADNDLLEDARIPHHIGYQFAEKGLVVAASGMLPSAFTAARTEAANRKRLERDIANSWVAWEGDYFAGYYDQVATDLALGGIVTGQLVFDAPPIARMAESVNLH